MEETTKGRIEDVKLKTAKNGNKYLSLKIDGQRYAVWEQKAWGEVNSGDLVEYKAEPKGKFMELTYLGVVEHTTDHPGNNDWTEYNLYEELRTKQIARMSCLRSAATIVSEIPDLPKEIEALSKYTLDLSRAFEKYVLVNNRRRKKKNNEAPPEYKKDGTPSPVQPGQPAPETLDQEEDLPF